MNCRHSPVIVIGMHRSGTSMVTHMLEGLGVFAGARKESNQEAIFFLEADRWLMSQTGASWEYPAGIRYLLENGEVRAMTADYVTRYLIESPRIISFLGWKKYLHYKSLFNFSTPWGWKCPLSTYTLPLWLDIFPDAKVIHIYRHGVDVANSLRQRTLRGSKRTPRQEVYYKARFLHWIRPKVGGFIGSMRCATLDGAFSLWEEYLSEARRQTQRLGKQATEIKYEEFLCEPHQALNHLAGFCDLSVSDKAVKSVASQAQRERAYAYRENPELRSFANRVARNLMAHDYYADHKLPNDPGAECALRMTIVG